MKTILYSEYIMLIKVRDKINFMMQKKNSSMH